MMLGHAATGTNNSNSRHSKMAANTSSSVIPTTNTEETPLSFPHSETERHYYEKLIYRGISLLQPYSVLDLAETYHAWYHSSSVDVAGCIIQQTIGLDKEGSSSTRKDTANDSGGIRSTYWLALCYWHIGEISTAYAILSPVAVDAEYIMEGCGDSCGKKALICSMWLIAMCCTRLDKWQEAEEHLETLSSITQESPLFPNPNTTGAAQLLLLEDEVNIYSVPTMADISDLKGLVCLRTNRMAESESHSLEALKHSPLLWSSCRRLCELSSGPKLMEALGSDIHIEQSKLPKRQQPADYSSAGEYTSGGTPLNRASKIVRIAPNTRQPVTGPSSSSTRRQRQLQLPESLSISSPTTATSTNTIDSSRVSKGTAKASKSTTTTALSTHLSLRNVNERRRIQPASVNKTPIRTRAAAAAATAKSDGISIATAGDSKKRTRTGSIVRPTATRLRQKTPDSLQAINHLQSWFRVNAKMQRHMLSYKATHALVALSQLPKQQQNGAWGLCALGKICFEAGRYPEAAKAFACARQLAPYRMRDMDIYSTLLWHMKQEVALAQLAHEVISVGRNWSPEAWVVVANCMSLDGDHGSALRSLGRSIQLYKAANGGASVVPRCSSGGVSGLAYAHTLVGHEHVASEDPDSAQQAFRTAIRIDPRHYNAWYGMGMVYLRLDNLDLADYHFKRALALNAQNPLLLQSAGAIYEHRGDYVGALEVYERVERMLNKGQSTSSSYARSASGKGKSAETTAGSSTSSSNSSSPAHSSNAVVVLGLQSHHAMNFVMFKRARVLVVLERYTEAAKVLEQLLHRCPSEFNVPFLLGQTCTKLGRYREAAACLTRALDIAPENSQSVNEALDALYMHGSGVEEEQEADGNEVEGEEEQQGLDQLPLSLLGGELSDLPILDTDSPLASAAGPSSMAGMMFYQRDGSHTPGDINDDHHLLSSSPYFESPALYGGRQGQAEWRQDWQSLDNANSGIDRVLDFDEQ